MINGNWHAIQWIAETKPFRPPTRQNAPFDRAVPAAHKLRRPRAVKTVPCLARTLAGDKLLTTPLRQAKTATVVTNAILSRPARATRRPRRGEIELNGNGLERTPLGSRYDLPLHDRRLPAQLPRIVRLLPSRPRAFNP